MPGAGYVSIALEAGRQLAAGRPISLLEARDVEVRHPVAVPKHPDSVETMYIARVQPSQDRNIIEAEFDFCYWPSSGTAAVRACSGRIVVYLGDGKEKSLPPRRASPTNLLNVSVADAYDVFKSIGLNYQDIFRGMSSIDRGSNHAVTQAVWDTSNLDQVYLVHPAILDVVFQSIFLAKSYPAKSLMHSAFLPVRIARVTVNPCVRVTNTTGSIEIDTESFVTHSDYRSIEGDMHVYNRANKPFLEVEGLSL
jgi:acyl transferase domain-containing protein